MDERAILLRNVLNEPSCDTARLVYADWLEEHDESERAEFIRVQIELARLFPTEQPRLLRERETELWPAAVFSIYDEVRPAKVIPDNMTVYKIDEKRETAKRPEAYVSRGFIGEISLPCAAFMQHAKAIFAAHPVTSIAFTNVRPSATDREPGFKDYFCWPRTQRHPLAFLMDAGFLKAGIDSWRDTEQECMNDASRAAVAYGRTLANIPILPLAAVGG